MDAHISPMLTGLFTDMICLYSCLSREAFHAL